MCGFWNKKRPVQDNSADIAFNNKLNQANNIEVEAYNEYFDQYAKLLNEIVSSIHRSIDTKHKGAPYTALLEETHALAVASIQQRTCSNYARVYDYDRKYDSELYNDLLALNNALNSPTSKNMEFLLDRAKKPWFGWRAETWNTIGFATMAIGIGLLLLALIISFYFVIFTPMFMLGFMIELGGGLGGASVFGLGISQYAPERETNLLKIENNLYDFANLYQQNQPSPSESGSELPNSMALSAS